MNKSLSICTVLYLVPSIKNLHLPTAIMFFIKRRAKISRNSPNSNIKNKDIFQIIIVTILTMVMTIGINYMLVSTFNDGIIAFNSEEITEDNIQDLAKINTEKINTKLHKTEIYLRLVLFM